MKRRTYLTTATVTATGLVLAGCAGGESPDDGDDDVGDDDGLEDENGDEELEDEEESEGEDEDEESDGDHSELVGTFDDFEALDPWYEFIGSIDAETEFYYEGSQSALLGPREDDGQVRVRRELDDSIDVTDVAPGLAMAADRTGTVLIQLQDSDGDYVEYSQRVRPGLPLVRHNFGLTRVRGAPDLTEVTLLQIIHWFGEDVEGSLWVDDFHFVPRPTTGKVMLQFHGGFETHYTEGLSILEEYDLPATVFVPTDRIRPDDQASGDRLTEAQVETLAGAGWTIGSYSARGAPLDEAGSTERESDIVDPIDWLEEHGYEDGARFFAFPGSRYDAESYQLVQEHYDLAFAGDARSQGYAANPHLCSVASSPDAGEAAELLDWTAELGGITTIPFYRLEESESIEGLEETAAHLDELVSAGELDVITPQEMADEYVY
ncbi:polysaccharide deacetylase family protein [Natronobeatus ordinarius]|uniref:polysaccharide deacetylase family protein n=1 Tax=Natronobeatus ordinarius TaxID=2963433 RepID=UPI0020CD276C|nr:polysaccharide deacetylase family protein [Natronobeatus ordinarius]